MTIWTKAPGVPTHYPKLSTLGDLSQMAPLGYEKYPYFQDLYISANSTQMFMKF